MSNPTRPTSLADALAALRDHTARYFLATLPQRRSQQAGAPSASTRVQTLADAAKVRTERRKASHDTDDALYVRAWGKPPVSTATHETTAAAAKATSTGDPVTDRIYAKAWPKQPA